MTLPVESNTPAALIEDGWQAWRAHTAARIALGRAGSGVPTREVLGFGLAHALARDAIHEPLDVDALLAELRNEGLEAVAVQSRAENREAFLRRPDLGRRLRDEDAAGLAALGGGSFDISVTLGDGLSAIAVQRHALPLLRELRVALAGDFSFAPVVVAAQARVALADEVGECLKARLAIIFIGERPGLSSPDSLGVYLTYEPRVGRVDAERNCISNVRPEGLRYEQAGFRLAWLVRQALRLELSGVGLKDESEVAVVEGVVG